MRLQKFLARAGVASRRKAERLIAAGRVRVDGQPVTQQGTQVEPGVSVVEVDGRPLGFSPPIWMALHKPPGYLCSRTDPGRRPTVYELLPEGEARKLFHVGRLDYMSEGLVLFTNEGDVAHGILHPSRETPRRYEISLLEPVPADLPGRILEGVQLEDGLARATEARFLPGGRRGERRLLMVLREGRNREIRRMIAEFGLRIGSLKRCALGPIELGDLAPGEHRILTEEEVGRLHALSEPTEASGST
jgi:pseudouridine synthase